MELQKRPRGNSSPGALCFFHRISHPSTGFAASLVKLAKTAKNSFKKLSQFRLVFYKLYGELSTARSLTVENPVERVEFHLKSGRETWTFTLSPQGFQHVENKIPFYSWYIGQNVENSALHIPPCPGAYCCKSRRAGSGCKNCAFLWQCGPGYGIL